MTGFITLAGAQGTGKTTVIDALSLDHYTPVTGITREFYRLSGLKNEAEKAAQKDGKIEWAIALMEYYLGRVTDQVRDPVNKGKTVIADRSLFDYLAYFRITEPALSKSPQYTFPASIAVRKFLRLSPSIITYTPDTEWYGEDIEDGFRDTSIMCPFEFTEVLTELATGSQLNARYNTTVNVTKETTVQGRVGEIDALRLGKPYGFLL